MSQCDVCMRDVDDGVSCGECVDSSGLERIAREEERATIVAIIERRASRAFNPGIAAALRGLLDEMAARGES